MDKPKIIQGVNFVGWAALFILIITSSVVYLQLNLNFDFAIKTFRMLAVPPEIKEKISTLIYHREFIRVLEANPDFTIVEDMT